MKQRVYNIVMGVVKGFLPFYLFTFNIEGPDE